MQTITQTASRSFVMMMIVMLIGLSQSSGQNYSMATQNCVATANRIEFDVFLNNAGPASMQINSTVIRCTFGAAILPTTGVNTTTIGFVNDGQSNIPLLWPPNLVPAFTYTAGIRQFSVSTNTGTYLNGGTCAAPSVPIGGSIKLGRFFIQNSQNFVAGAPVGLTWVASSSAIVYLNCSGTVSSAAALVKTLSTPCVLTIPSSCAISASIESQIDNVCFGGNTGSATATSTGGVAPVTYSWNTIPVQTGAIASNLAAGTYTVTATGADACATTTTVTITAPLAPLTTSTTASACGSFVWPLNGLTYSASGVYVVHTTSGSGCDIANTLDLTITPNTTNTTTASACDTYTWTANGQTYTTSGTYTSVTGCHTEILELTITPSTSNTTTASACDTYTWGVNGQTYTVSGTYTSVTGCHTEVLNLTITPSTSNTTTASACDTYTWGVNGQTYTASGTYTSVTGCHTEVLNLTITPSTSNTTTASACDTYSWTVNGQTYTASGTYTSVTGCHTEILNLTITPGTSNTTTASVCDSYSWTVNGQTYTTSGTYTSVSGCHTEILVLTVNPTPATPVVTVANNCNATATLSTSALGSLLWSNGSTSSSINVTVGGSYSVIATMNGCSSGAGSAIAAPVPVLVASASAGSIVCFGGSTSVVISAAGGTPAYVGTGSFTQFAGTMSYTVTDANGCSSSTSVTLSQPTKVEGTTSTIASGCAGNTGSATVAATGGSGTYTYLWSNGQTTLTATSLAIGNYTVIITDGSGCTGSASATVLGAGGSPATPDAINGAGSVCRNSVGLVYSVNPVFGAASYVWTLPSGITGTSTSNSITVSVSSTYGGGFICVAAVNPCGTSSASCMNLPVIATFPSQPSSIVGPAIACGPGTYTYSTTATNALGFTWTLTGSGALIVSGQGTNSIEVSVPAGFGQGSVQVIANNCYGNSAVRGMTITGIPTHSNAVSGPSYVCAGNTATYTMGIVQGVSTYTWTSTGDATLLSSSVSGNLISATFSFGPLWTSGNITITASNSCGSFARTFVVRSTPTQPGGITGPGAGLCGLSNVGYSIAAVAGATSYTWSVPVGVSIVSTAPNGLSIVASFSPLFVSNSANICVTANNSCGAGVARCFAVTSRPIAPTITGPIAVCKTNSAILYSIAPVASATSYAWSVLGGASISPAGTSATINYNTATTTSAVLRVNGLNACGASQPGVLTVNVSLFCRTSAEDMLGLTSEMSAYPNPTSGKATITFTADKNAKYSLKVMDMIGNTIQTDVIQATEGMNTKDLDFVNVAKGLYMVSLSNESGKNETIKLIIQ